MSLTYRTESGNIAKCKRCGTVIVYHPRKRRDWSGKVKHRPSPFCPKCKKFMIWKTMKYVREV